MSKNFFEERGTVAPHRGHAAGDTDIEKAASQLVSDVKYKVKKEMGAQSGASNLNPAQVAKKYMEKLSASPAPPAVKALAKKKLMPKPTVSAEQFEIGDIVKESLVSALTKVFVEGVNNEDVEDEFGNEYLQELYTKVNKEGERLYHIRVTDKKTKNTYTRDATRAKIAELRANPNISSVEMSDYDKDSEEEKNKGEKTAKVKSGKGLNNDGNLANNYPPYDKVTRGDVIAGATGNDQMGGKKKVRKEAFEYLFEVEKKDKKDKIIDIKKGNKSCVTVGPEVSEETVLEMSVSVNQQQAAGAALSAKRGKTDPSTLKGSAREMYDSMTEKQLRDFAKTKHKGLPEKVEEECGCEDEKKGDSRQMKTKLDLVKNALRSRGLNMSYEMDGEQIDELVTSPRQQIDSIAAMRERSQQRQAAASSSSASSVSKLTPSVASRPMPTAPRQQVSDLQSMRQRSQQRQMASSSGSSQNLAFHYEPEGEVVSEEESDIMRDRRQEVGGMSANADQKPARPNPPAGSQRRRKRRSSAPSAMDVVRQSIIAKYGKGSLR